jgi:hypothetical protein
MNKSEDNVKLGNIDYYQKNSEYISLSTNDTNDNNHATNAETKQKNRFWKIAALTLLLFSVALFIFGLTYYNVMSKLGASSNQ